LVTIAKSKKKLIHFVPCGYILGTVLNLPLLLPIDKEIPGGTYGYDRRQSSIKK